MAIKNNDDVAHLLDATGRAGSSYREFEGAADHVSAPLIDAVFASGPPEPTPDELSPLGIGVGKGDLLSEVFDRPPPVSQPEPRPATIPLAAAGPMVASPPTPVLNPSRRSLDDIRRIITRPAEEPAKAPPTDSLNGLFDRLAG